MQSSGRRSRVPAYSASISAPFATSNSSLLRASSGGPLTSGSSHAEFERRIVAARGQEQQADSLLSFHSGCLQLASSTDAESRATGMRKLRRVQQQNAELALQYELENAAAEKERRRALAEQDTALAASMLRTQSEQAAEANARRRICESSSDIAALTAQLEAAKTNAARHQQLQQRQESQREEKQQEQREERQQQAAREQQRVLEQQQQQAAAQQAADRARVLQLQCEEKEQSRAAAYSGFLREKEEVEAIVSRIEQEDAERRRGKQRAQEELQAVIAAYLQQREQHRQQAALKARQELEAIAAYCKDMEQRAAQQAARLRERTARDDLIHAAISAEMARKEREREETELMLQELHREQRETLMLREVEKQQAAILKLRADMRRENELCLERKRRQRQQEAEAERAAQSQLSEQLQRDLQYDAANREKRARMKAAYQQQIAAMLREKSERQQAALRAEEAEQQQRQREAESELAVVEQERERLLMQLASQLLPYLPKGVFRDQHEMQRVTAAAARLQEASSSSRTPSPQGEQSYTATSHWHAVYWAHRSRRSCRLCCMSASSSPHSA